MADLLVRDAELLVTCDGGLSLQSPIDPLGQA